MSIAAQNTTYFTAGPTASNQTIAASALSIEELSLIGTATFTGDGTATTGVLNYIDGTNTLAFTPRAILAARVGGTDTAKAQVLQAVDNADGGKTATVNFSAAPSAAGTVIVAFFILK